MESWDERDSELTDSSNSELFDLDSDGDSTSHFKSDSESLDSDYLSSEEFEYMSDFMLEEEEEEDETTSDSESMDYMKDMPQRDLEQRTLFPHQTAAIQLLRESDMERGTFVVACGGGKTLMQAIPALGAELSAIFVPTKALARQWIRILRETFTEFEGQYGLHAMPRIHLISSETDIIEYDAGVSHVFVTLYQSAHRLRELCMEYGLLLDLVCCDEAHHVSTRRKRRFVDPNNPACIPSSRYGFFTATPTKVMRKHSEIFGTVRGQLSFKAAVDTKIIKTFRCVLPTAVHDNRHLSLLRSLRDLMHRADLYRVIVFTQNVRIRTDGQRETYSIEALQPWVRELGDDTDVEVIDASVSAHERARIYMEFDTPAQIGSRRKVILSCRTMNEGINLVHADGVVIADHSRSVIQTIQRGLRACRLTPLERDEWARGIEPKEAVVMYPLAITAEQWNCVMESIHTGTSEDRAEIMEEVMRKNPEAETPMLILNLLREVYNAEIELEYMMGTRRMRVGIIGSRQGTHNGGSGGTGSTERSRHRISAQLTLPDLDYDWDIENMVRMSGDVIGLRLVLGSDRKWRKMFVKYQMFYETEGREPKQKSKDPIEKSLGYWRYTQRQAYRKGMLTSERIDLLTNLPFWKWEEEDPFPVRFQEYQTFYEIQGREPKMGSNDPIEKSLARWRTTQRQAYRKGKLPSERIEQLTNLPFWKWEEDDSFPYRLQEYQTFYEIQGREPKMGSNDPIEKSLGEWRNYQRQAYRKGMLTSERIELLTNLPFWTWGSISNANSHTTSEQTTSSVDIDTTFSSSSSSPLPSHCEESAPISEPRFEIVDTSLLSTIAPVSTLRIDPNSWIEQDRTPTSSSYPSPILLSSPIPSPISSSIPMSIPLSPASIPLATTSASIPPDFSPPRRVVISRPVRGQYVETNPASKALLNGILAMELENLMESCVLTLHDRVVILDTRKFGTASALLERSPSIVSHLEIPQNDSREWERMHSHETFGRCVLYKDLQEHLESISISMDPGAESSRLALLYADTCGHVSSALVHAMAACEWVEGGIVAYTVSANQFEKVVSTNQYVAQLVVQMMSVFAAYGWRLELLDACCTNEAVEWDGHVPGTGVFTYGKGTHMATAVYRVYRATERTRVWNAKKRMRINGNGRSHGVHVRRRV